MTQNQWVKWRDDEKPTPETTRTNTFRWYILSFVCLGIAVLTLTSSTWSNSNSFPLHSLFSSSTEPVDPYHSNDSTTLHCGSSRTEADARGCVFDVMAAAWIPKLCYDADAATEALLENSTSVPLGIKGAFPWFLEEDHVNTVSTEILGSLHSEMAYSTQGYHIAHCLYIWRLGVLAMNRLMKGERGVYVHFRATDRLHTMHCSKVIASQGTHPLGAVIPVYFKVGYCSLIDELQS